ncbi:DUF2164 domain-containing protein [bacterium BFN5]|nr:DUF2164 domain-containing protein [bacterium BFN5]QJW45386.1 DUF2164 domain-containing protein [bacterium BFN5]
MKITLSNENRGDAIKSIQKFFLTERDEEISEFQASMLLDFILKDVGIYIYNQALSDSHQLMLQKIEDIFSLEKQPTIDVRR